MAKVLRDPLLGKRSWRILNVCMIRAQTLEGRYRPKEMKRNLFPVKYCSQEDELVPISRPTEIVTVALTEGTIFSFQGLIILNDLFCFHDNQIV